MCGKAPIVSCGMPAATIRRIVRSLTPISAASSARGDVALGHVDLVGMGTQESVSVVSASAAPRRG